MNEIQGAIRVFFMRAGKAERKRATAHAPRQVSARKEMLLIR